MPYGSKPMIPTHFPRFHIGTTFLSSATGFYPLGLKMHLFSQFFQSLYIPTHHVFLCIQTSVFTEHLQYLALIVLWLLMRVLSWDF